MRHIWCDFRFININHSHVVEKRPKKDVLTWGKKVKELLLYIAHRNFSGSSLINGKTFDKAETLTPNKLLYSWTISLPNKKTQTLFFPLSLKLSQTKLLLFWLNQNYQHYFYLLSATIMREYVRFFFFLMSSKSEIYTNIFFPVFVGVVFELYDLG